MDRVTQQNAAMVEESNAAARQLADQSTQLSNLVNAFQISTGRVVELKPREQTRAKLSHTPHRAVHTMRANALPAPVEQDWAEF